MDLMQPVFDALGDAVSSALGLGLRSIENEWGPGQVECTFAPARALEAADNVVLFRTATRQICRRLGYFATFMCRPALKGYYASGWHLHQSLVDAASGANLFAPTNASDVLSPLGRAISPDCCTTRCPATVFATPTVNGYRRFRANSLAPDRATWGYDHRGVMLRVLGGEGDPATRIENRDRRARGQSLSLHPFAGRRRPRRHRGQPAAAARRRRALCGGASALPKSLPEALDALEKEPLFRRELGDTFIDYFVTLKRTEAGRYQRVARRGGRRPEATSRPHGSRTSISISFDVGALATNLRGEARRLPIAAMTLDEEYAMTALEKIGPSPTRLGGTALYDWDELVQEDRAHRLIYTDPAIFEAEMTHIFGGTWTYLAHESEIPNDNDFITRRMGLRPLIIVRDSNGKIRALYNRCTHRGTTLCRWEKGNARSFQCPYHGWNFHNTGKLRGVPWPDGYAADLRDPKYNVAQVPRVESYRGFIFGTLNMDALPLTEHLGPIATVIDEWLDRNPGGKVVVCEANRIKYKGNWKLAYDNSCDGYHVAYSHRSLLETENRFAGDNAKGMSYYNNSPDSLAMYMRYTGNGNHFKDKRPNLEKRPGGLWALESRIPAWSTTRPSSAARYGDRADALLDLAGSEPVNINVFPNFSLLGNHIQVFEPVSVDETNAVWYGTMIVDDGDARRGASPTSTRCACARRRASRTSARSTTSPISSRSSAA